MNITTYLNLEAENEWSLTTTFTEALMLWCLLCLCCDMARSNFESLEGLRSFPNPIVEFSKHSTNN
jgi:hypothetical protein